VGGKIKLCDPLVTHGPYLSALEILHNKKCYINLPSCHSTLWFYTSS